MFHDIFCFSPDLKRVQGTQDGTLTPQDPQRCEKLLVGSILCAIPSTGGGKHGLGAIAGFCGETRAHHQSRGRCGCVQADEATPAEHENGCWLVVRIAGESHMLSDDLFRAEGGRGRTWYGLFWGQTCER